jgi:hypothetical protein
VSTFSAGCANSKVESRTGTGQAHTFRSQETDRRSRRPPRQCGGAKRPPPHVSSMNHQPEELPVTIPPDARAYVALLIGFSPLFVIWALGWWIRGSVNAPLIAMILVLTAVALYLVTNKTVRLDLWAVSQGWPFKTKIAYHEIARIHHIYISSRYASTLCLAISAVGAKKRITLPLRSFGVPKRKKLMGILKMKAPQARVDASSSEG